MGKMTNFNSLVKEAREKEREYYSNEKNISLPNPYYVGFGNPNADIIIFGKEKAFNSKTDNENLKCESLNNAKEWELYLENNCIPHRKVYEQNSIGYINAFFPYFGVNKKGGHTWKKYDKLLESTSLNGFFEKAFISEINPNPSKNSPLKRFKSEDRINFLKQDFYKSFKTTVLACGDYLEDQIEEIFGVEKVKDCSELRKKLVIYKSKDNDRVLINTRQLSNDVSNDYLDNIRKRFLK